MQNSIKKIVVLLIFPFIVYGSEINVFLTSLVIDYKEYATDGALLDSEESQLGSDIVGIEIDYANVVSQPIVSNIYLKYMFYWSFQRGTSKYIGAFLLDDEGYGSLVSQTTNTMHQLGAKITLLKPINSYFLLQMGAGIGLYLWQRELSAIQEEDYVWFPLEINLAGKFRLPYLEQSYLTLEGFYSKGLLPTMEAVNMNTTFDLGGEYSYGTRMQLSYKLLPNTYVLLGYEYKKQVIEQSNIVQDSQYIYYEPDSIDYQQTLKVGVQYIF